MRDYFLKHMETFIYGVLGLVFSAAFFFGVLYPSHSISRGAYRVVSSPRNIERPVLRVAEEYEPEEIEYTFFLYEWMKNS